MRQALHIFKKDVRYMRGEIGLLLALAVTLGFGDGWAELLWTIVAINVIARVIHAEAIPGHNQFWITRPYRWKSLLGAKLLFILAFVNLPLLAAQWYMIASAHFPLAGSLPGLIWSQVLFVMCLSLPAGALAAITSGIAPFLFWTLIPVAVGFISSSGILDVLMNQPFRRAPTVPGVEWVRNALVIAAFACVSALLLYVQYRNRRTNASQLCAVGGAGIAVAAYLYLPWSIALGVQSRLSKQPFDGSSLRMALDSAKSSKFGLGGGKKITQVEMILPIAVSGVPREAELQADALSVTIQGADGRTWNSGFADVNPRPRDAGLTVVDGYLLVDPSFFKDEGSHPVTIRAALYLTLFSNPQSRTIPIQGEGVNVMDGLQCGAGFLNQLYCRSAFRWPRRRVYGQFGAGGMEPFTWSVSYSPFPAMIGFNPFEQHWVSTSESASQATIITKEPVSHFRRDLEIRDVNLTDFTRGGRSTLPGSGTMLR